MFHVFDTFKYVLCCPVRWSFADIHEIFFQPAKLSGMDCVELQVGLIADCQEWQFEVSKLSDNWSTILQEDRFADVQE